MSDSSTATGRHMENESQNYIIIIAVGLSAILLIAIAVLVYLLIVYLRARKVSRNVSIARSMHNASSRSNGLLDHFTGPMWMSDLHDPNQETGTLSHEQGYNNIINAGYNESERTKEPSEPLYANTLRSAAKYIAENTPEYDNLRQTKGQYNYGTSSFYPPDVSQGYSGDGASNYPPHPDGARMNDSPYDFPKGTKLNESPYDFPKGTTVNESPYDFPKGTTVNESPYGTTVNESPYDFPKGAQPPTESPYDYPPNNASVSPEVYNHPSHQASGYSAPEEQPYANLRSLKAEESPYDHPPALHREVSSKGRSSRRGLPKFNSPFAR